MTLHSMIMLMATLCRTGLPMPRPAFGTRHAAQHQARQHPVHSEGRSRREATARPRWGRKQVQRRGARARRRALFAAQAPPHSVPGRRRGSVASPPVLRRATARRSSRLQREPRGIVTGREAAPVLGNPSHTSRGQQAWTCALQSPSGCGAEERRQKRQAQRLWRLTLSLREGAPRTRRRRARHAARSSARQRGWTKSSRPHVSCACSRSRAWRAPVAMP
jgi:hypothetical protein